MDRVTPDQLDLEPESLIDEVIRSMDRLTPDQLFLESLPLLDDVIRFVCRHFRLSREDAQDFGQELRLKLVQEDYRVLRVWKRESSLRSYLASVALHFGRDRLTRKFHSSAKAKELGKVAIWLERLLVRDHLGYDHAKEVLRSRYGVALSDAELDQLRDQLPPRTWPPLLEVEDDQEHPDPGDNPEKRLFSKQAGERRKAVYTILACAMEGRSAREQMFVRLLFLEGLTVAEISRAWKEKQKPLYRELERIVGALGKHLEEKGHSRTDIEDLLLGMGEDQDDDGLPEGESLWKQ
jgi:RNA polymerase sigma factor for flagellar operon FliA